jgi:beta-lactamase superfamily II metal-dependent hydrolase
MTRNRALSSLIVVVLVGSACLVHAGTRRPVLATARGDADLLWIMVDVTVRGVIQGDAHLLIGRSRAVLIDAGEYASGRDRLVPLLERLGITRIDAVFITHQHFDHMGGVLALMDANVPIGAIYTHGTTTPESCAREPWGCRWPEVEGLRERAGDRGIPLRGWSAWSKTRIAKSARLLKVVAFEHGDCPIPCDINDTSLIARLEIHGHRVLFTGDLNRSLSDWLVQHKGAEIRAPFLKVPHHGTEATASDEFFQTVRPRLSFVPSPARLWCSDRSARIRARLAELSDEIFVNGVHGDVFTYFFSDGTYLIKPSRQAASTCP